MINSMDQAVNTEKRGCGDSTQKLSSGGSQARSVDEQHNGSFDLGADPVLKRFHRDKRSLSKSERDKVPEFIIEPRRQFVDEGKTAKFKASFDGPPDTELYWLKNDSILKNDSRHRIYQDKELHWLEICGISSEDGGTYMCRLQSMSGSAQSAAELEVYVKPTSLSSKMEGFVAPQVDVHLTDQYAAPGDRSVIMECKFSNAIDSSTTWYRDGKKLNAGFFAKQTFDGRLARLTLNRVTLKEGGVYECVAQSTGGEARTKATLTITTPGTRSIPPKFVSPLTDQTLVKGDKLVLQSKVTGYPTPTIKWYKNREEIKSAKNLITGFDGSTAHLKMTEVDISDTDVYKCVAENDAGRDQIKANITVRAATSASADDFKEPPIFVRELHDMEADDGDRVELVVEVKGTPPIDIMWLHRNKEISYDDPVFKLISENHIHKLIIPEVSAEDNGQFVCEAYNQYGDTDTFCTLCVRENVSRKCMNKTNHSYVKSGTEKHLKNSEFESESEKSLQISQADSGYDETSLQKPDFILKPHSVEVNEGQSAIFLCRTIGNPPPKIVWRKQGEIIEADSRHKMTYGDDCILEIKRSTSKDSGSYSCVLTNSAGSVTMETILVVKATNPQPEAPSDLRSVLRKTSKQEDIQVNEVEKSPKTPSNVGDRVSKLNSTPVNMEKEFTRSRINFQNQSTPNLNSPGKFGQKLTVSPSKMSNSSLSEKIGKFQKLENKSPQSPQRFDFRSVLKSKQHEESKVKSITNSLDSTDGAKKTNFQDVLSAKRQSHQREVTLSKPKSLHESISPSWKSQTPLKKSVENLHKTFSENSVKNKEEKIDYRSVLKRKENVPMTEGQKSLSLKPNRIKPEPQKEVNNNNYGKSEISPLRNDFSSQNSNEQHPAGSRVNDKNIRSDGLKSYSSEQSSKNGPTSKTNIKTEIDIQHVLSRRNTKLEQQPQGKNDKTSPPDFKEKSLSSKTSSLTSKQNEHQKNSNSVQQEKFSSISLKLQKQPLEAEKSSSDTYATQLVQKPDMCSNLENMTSSIKYVNFKVSENVKHNEIKEENKIVNKHQRNTENSVLGHNVSSVLKIDQKSSLVEEKDKELPNGQQKQSAAFESKIKYDVKEDYKNILTKRKSDVNLTEKQSKELKSDRKKDEEHTTFKITSKNEVTVGSDNLLSTNQKSKSLNTAVTNKEEVKGGKSKLQSINGSNVNTLGSDKKINDSNIQWEEPRSVLKRRRSSSSFNKFDKISPTGLDQIDLAETLTRQPPLFKSTIHDQSVKEGESVTMECHVTGVPKPEIIWYMKDSQIKPSKFFRMTYEDNLARLIIAGAYPEDIGTYTCTATNSSGTERCSCHLFVQECSSTTSNNQSDDDVPPETPTQKAPYDLSKNKEITDEKDRQDKKKSQTPGLKVPYINEINPTNQTAVVGQKAVIHGSFTSSERPDVKWYKGQKEIHTCADMSVSTTGNNSTLTINKVQLSDGGKYQLVVENSSGCVSAVASINIQDVPEPPVGKPYASEVLLHSVILSWCGPAYDGGSQVTGYKVEICKAEEEAWETLTHSCHSTSFSVNNLEAHTPYFFRVSAKNKHGLSKPSDMSSVVVTKDRRISVRLSVESDDVFLTSPTSSGSLVSPFSPDEDLPFSPRVINISTDRKFEDDYDLKDDLGKGKFGKVSRCTEKSSGRIFAAKVIKCRSSKDRENIRQEVEIMNQLTHPKLVLLWDAFETAKSMVLVLELVAGGELFDRVVDEDLDLTERDCVHFVRQICDGVQYMHTKSIMHLDLKPENILCVNKESNLIKIIDFGLARPCKEDEGLRVMFGTPEFIAPEVVNYEVIGLPTDIWSLGVICYVLLSGLSPFMGDSDVETLANVTRGDFDFDDEAFEEISDDAKQFIETTLQKNKAKRPNIDQCLGHKWLAQSERNSSKKLRQSLRNLKQFMARRKWQKMGNAIRAVGRMSSAMQKLQKSRSDSASSVQSDSSDTINSQSDTAKIPSQLSPSTPSAEDKDSDKMTSQTDVVKKTLMTTRNVIPDGSDIAVTSDTSLRTDSKTNLTHRQTANNERTSKYENMFSKPVHHEYPNPNTFHDNNQIDRDNKIERNKQIQNESFSKRKELTFLKEMIDCEAFEGDIVRFDIQISSGDIKPTVEWYYEDTLITEDRQHTFSYVNSENGEFSLIIRNVREKNEGEYMCKVFNSTEELTCFADLTILGTGAF